MKFKIGDRVVVFRRSTRQEELDRHCEWMSPYMDLTINKTGTVRGISRNGNILIDFDKNESLNCWYYPLPTVRLIEGQMLFSFMYD